ncbi:MAG: TraB/VirB10 family protein [Nitrospinae bacterium]|nr:TraB/VirB10 family protein [Nitrospinota bacterium]
MADEEIPQTPDQYPPAKTTLWSGLSAQTKSYIWKGIGIAGVIVFSTEIYLMMDDSQEQPPPKPAVGVEKFESNMSSGSVKILKQSEAIDKDLTIDRLTKQIEEFKNPKEAKEPGSGAEINKNGNTPAGGAAPADLNNLPLPPPPGKLAETANVSGMPYPPPQGGAATQNFNLPPIPQKKEERAVRGGFLVVTAKVEEPKKEQDSKKKPIAYIPSASWTEAVVLIGGFAPVVKQADVSAAPFLLRIQTPAQLPNEAKADISGCFVLAAGVGSLQDKRAHLNAYKLSCVNRRKQAVIDQTIDAYVAETDPSIDGIRGPVVAELKEPMITSIILGSISGIGDVMKATSSTQIISPLGQTQALDTNKLGQAAVGGALTKGFDKLQEFYLRFIELSMPTIGVSAGIRVNVVFKNGVELQLKEICLEGEECSGE